MTRIDLVDNTAIVKHIDFRVLPATTEGDFACTPEGLLPLSAAAWLSQKLKAGCVSGKLGKYLWYRLLTTPAEQNPILPASWQS